MPPGTSPGSTPRSPWAGSTVSCSFPVGGKSSEFIRLGDSFDGYLLRAYEPKTNTLDLEHDGKITRVTLAAEAAVPNAPLVAELSAQLQRMGREFAKEQKAKFMGGSAAPTPASAGPASAPSPELRDDARRALGLPAAPEISCTG